MVRSACRLVGFCAAFPPPHDTRAGTLTRASGPTVLTNLAAAAGPTDIDRPAVRQAGLRCGAPIDGAPTMIVQNMDGAGGVIGAQYRR